MTPVSSLEILGQLEHVRNALLWRTHQHTMAQVEDVASAAGLAQAILHGRLDGILRRK